MLPSATGGGGGAMRPGFRNHRGVVRMRSSSQGGGETEEEGKEDEDGGSGSGGRHRGRYHMIPRNNFDGGDAYEPLPGALLFEPLSYRSAIREGVMHVVCLQLRPNGLVEDPGQQGRGTDIAELVFPDKILSYNPLVYTLRMESAYKTYLKSKAKKKDD
jgi:hypothetical protein